MHEELKLVQHHIGISDAEPTDPSARKSSPYYWTVEWLYLDVRTT